jgi:WD40 repeat protein
MRYSLCIPVLLATTFALAQSKQPLSIPLNPTARPVTTPVTRAIITRGPVVPVPAVAFAPAGNLLAAAGYREVVIWDLDEAKIGRRLAGQIAGQVQSLAFNNDASLLAVGEGLPGASGAVRLFDMKSGRLIRGLEGPADVVCALALSPDGKLLAAASADGAAYLWSLPDGKLLTTIREHNDRLAAIAFSADGRLLATGGADRVVLVWEVPGCKQVNRIPQPDIIHALAFAPTGDLLAVGVGGADANAIRTRPALDEVDPKTGARKPPASGQARTLDTGGGMPLAIRWSPDGARIFAACSDDTVKILNAAGGIRASMAGHADWAYSVAASPDGTRLASGSADGTVRLWTAEGLPVATLVQLSPGTEQWVILAAAGPFAASDESAIAWVAGQGSATSEQLARQHRNPDRMKEIVSGKKPAPPAPAPAPAKPVPATPAATGGK